MHIGISRIRFHPFYCKHQYYQRKGFLPFTIEDDGKEMIEESSVIFLGSDNYNPPSNRLHPELGIEIMKTTVLAHHGDIQITQEKTKEPELSFISL